MTVEDALGNTGVALVGNYFHQTNISYSGADKKMQLTQAGDASTNTEWTITGLVIDPTSTEGTDMFFVATDGTNDYYFAPSDNTTLADDDTPVSAAISYIALADLTTSVACFKAPTQAGTYTVTLTLTAGSSPMAGTATFTRTGGVPDIAGNNGVKLVGNYLGTENYGGTQAITLTRDGITNTWTGTVDIDPAEITNEKKYLYFVTDNGSKWHKQYNSDIALDTEMDFLKGEAWTDNRYPLEVKNTMDKGKYSVTIEYKSETTAKVTFSLIPPADVHHHEGVALVGGYFGTTGWSDATCKLTYDESSAATWTITGVRIDANNKSGDALKIYIVDKDGNKYYKSADNGTITVDTNMRIAQADAESGDKQAFTIDPSADEGIYTITVTYRSPEEGTINFHKTADLPEPSDFISYYQDGQCITPGTDGIKTQRKKVTINGTQTSTAVDVMHVMFGNGNAEKGIPYYENSNWNSKCGLSWSANNRDNDFDYPDALTHFAEPGWVQDRTMNAKTEADGNFYNHHNGGKWLAPVGGDFIRMEPEYPGTVTIWINQGTGESQLFNVLDQDGLSVSITPVKNAKITNGGGERDGEGNSAYSFEVKGGYSYYGALRSDNLKFVAVKFTPAASITQGTITYNDGTLSTSASQGDFVEYTTDREFHAGWMHPIVLPFTLSETQTRAIFGDDVQVFYLNPHEHSHANNTNNEYKSVDKCAISENHINFTKHVYQMLYAGQPAFIVPLQEVNGFTVNATYQDPNVQSYAIDKNNKFQVTGSYSAVKPTAATVYYISNSGDTSNSITLYKATGNNIPEMHAGRVWIQADATAPLLTRVGYSNNEGDDQNVGTSGIQGIEADFTPCADTTVYNLQGIAVSTGSLEGLAPGMYIQGGKKIIVR